MIKTAVIGHPINHSKSPIIHRYWIERYKMQGKYEAFDITPANLNARVTALVDAGYTGFNITLPHKEAMFYLCAEVDDVAHAVGAVNTVMIKEGLLYGTNTDVFGFTENIKSNAPEFDFKAGKAVVLGAGGAARAVIKGLIDEGVPSIVLLNRTKERAQRLLETATNASLITVMDWEHRDTVLKAANILVNTTSLGMDGKDQLDIDLSQLPEHTLVNDIVYTPLHTALLSKAEARGNPIVTGIGMLLHQARPAFQQWFGIMPDVDVPLETMVLA